MSIKLKFITGINWLTYSNWCKDNGFNKSNFRTLELFIEIHKSEEWFKFLRRV